jgi:uncharacterized phage-like protein YoqJ
MILAGTGHRPPRLGLAYTPEDQGKLRRFIEPHLKRLKPEQVISGGAQGFDQALALAAWVVGIPYVVAVPFVGQDAKWPDDSKELYRHILDHAQRVVVVCDGDYANWKFAARDRWMVDEAEGLIALYDGSGKSGTAITVGYAQEQGKPVENLWESWERLAD